MNQKCFERTIDELGRVEIPLEIMEEISLKENDALSVSIIDGKMALFPADKMCFFCCRTYESDKLHKIGGKNLCINCITAIGSNELVSDQHNISSIVRKIDELSHFMLPITERCALGLTNGDNVFIYADEGWIYIKPSVKTCWLCRNKSSLMKAGNYYFCSECIEKISIYIKN